MADLTPAALDTKLTKRAFSAASAGGDAIVSPGQGQDVLVEFRATNAAGNTITISAQVSEIDLGQPYGIVTISDKQVTLAQDEEAVVKIPRAGYLDANNKAQISYDDATGLFLRALKL